MTVEYFVSLSVSLVTSTSRVENVHPEIIGLVGQQSALGTF